MVIQVVISSPEKKERKVLKIGNRNDSYKTGKNHKERNKQINKNQKLVYIGSHER